MKKKINFILFFFVIFFLNSSQIYSNSSKVYKDNYQNPINVLNSFLWKDNKGSEIGLISKFNILNRNLTATIHPVSIEPEKIKIAFSKLRYFNSDKEANEPIFDNKDLNLISKHVSKGLSITNNSHDIIFNFIQKKRKIKEKTSGIIFVEKNSLNLVFFFLKECEKGQNKTKKKKEFYKNHPNFSFKKSSNNCFKNLKNRKVLVTNSKGIYKKNTNNDFEWIIFTPTSLINS